MKYVWELHDIVPGRRVQSPGRSTEVWMIGYDPAESDEGNRTLISLNDGMAAMRKRTAGDLMREFNHNGYRPMELRLDDVGPKS